MKRNQSERRLRNVLIVCVCLLWTYSALRAGLRLESGMIDILASLTIACAVTRACIADSRVLGKPIVRSLQWVMFFTWPLAAPIYLVWSRRFIGVCIALGMLMLGLMSIGIGIMIALVLEAI